MLLLIEVERTFAKSGKRPSDSPIAWALDGCAFVIRDREELVHKWLPMFFPRGKFSSFTRKLYRWEFRQVNLPRDKDRTTDDKSLVFAHNMFQRDNIELMVYMKSVTAARTRREQEEKKFTESLLNRPPRAAGREPATLPPPAASLVLPQGPQVSMIQGRPYSSHLPGLNPYHNALLSSIEPILGSGLTNPQLPFGLLSVGPQLHQQLALAALLRNLQTQPSLHPSPVPLLSMAPLVAPIAARQEEEEAAGGESKQAPNEEERLRQLAAILSRGLRPPPPREDDGASGR